jgi:hypothetical protein
MKRKTLIETADIIKSAISEWYFEHGIPEPRWQVKKDPDWWIEEKKKYEG